MDVEESAIRAFMLPDRQDRWIALLASTARRKKAADRLAHRPDLDPRYAHRVPSGEQAVVDILSALRRRGAPPTCHVISESGQLDGHDLPLDKAVHAVVGSSLGTILICVPDRLAYYEGEDDGERYILEKPR